MTELRARIRKSSLHGKIMSAEETIPFFKDGMIVGFSGFGPSGDPKLIPTVLADHVEQNGLQGTLGLTLLAGASITAGIDARWAELGITRQRWPFTNSKGIRNRINRGELMMGDKHLGMFPQDVLYGFYSKDRGGKIDLAVIEATAITEEGGIILAAGVGAAPELIQAADQVIIELNTHLPSFEGLHDIVVAELPPGKKPLQINHVSDRIGLPYVPCPEGKIVAIVESTLPDRGNEKSPSDESSLQIAANILDFFRYEVKVGRLPKNLLPLQSGSGNIANAVVDGLANGSFWNLNVWSEVFQDSMLNLIDSGKLDFASCTSYTLSDVGFKKLYGNWEHYVSKVILRPSQITNNPDPIRRLGVIAMNTGIDFDIYGHVNSSLVNGSRIISGIGGARDFLGNAYLSMVHCHSARASKSDPTGISSVLPFSTHVDSTEHDLDILVTEQGLADLRGLAPRQRAQVIIDRCAHPEYRPILQEYLDRATREGIKKGEAHEPHLLVKAFKMQQHLADHGTMKIENWD